MPFAQRCRNDARAGSGWPLPRWADWSSSGFADRRPRTRGRRGSEASGGDLRVDACPARRRLLPRDTGLPRERPRDRSGGGRPFRSATTCEPRDRDRTKTGPPAVPAASAMSTRSASDEPRGGTVGSPETGEPHRRRHRQAVAGGPILPRGERERRAERSFAANTRDGPSFERTRTDDVT